MFSLLLIGNIISDAYIEDFSIGQYIFEFSLHLLIIFAYYFSSKLLRKVYEIFEVCIFLNFICSLIADIFYVLINN